MRGTQMSEASEKRWRTSTAFLRAMGCDAPPPEGKVAYRSVVCGICVEATCLMFSFAALA